jgi:hypothetical protein
MSERAGTAWSLVYAIAVGMIFAAIVLALWNR